MCIFSDEKVTPSKLKTMEPTSKCPFWARCPDSSQHCHYSICILNLMKDACLIISLLIYDDLGCPVLDSRTKDANG